MRVAMGDDTTKKALLRYVDTANALAESVKRNIQKDGCIDDKTVLALNEFIIAANAINDSAEILRNKNNKYN